MIRSAVAVVETPEYFVLQRRPDLPGKLAYPGKLQLLGGHANDGETLSEAVVRELGEETSLDPAAVVPEPIWEGLHTGEDKDGKPITRHVGLFRVVVGGLFELREQGELVTVSKDLPEVQGIQGDLTPFAYEALCKIMERTE